MRREATAGCGVQALPQYFPVGVFGTGALLAKATATSSAMIERVGNILLGQLRWRGGLSALDRAPGSMAVAPARAVDDTRVSGTGPYIESRFL